MESPFGNHFPAGACVGSSASSFFYFVLLSRSLFFSFFFSLPFNPTVPQQHINNHGNGLQAAPEWADHRQALKGFLHLLAVVVECNQLDLYTYSRTYTLSNPAHGDLHHADSYSRSCEA